MLHCGAELVDRAQLALVPTPAPTPSWHPVAHIDFLEEIDYAIGRFADVSIASEEHGLNHDGAEYFGCLYLERESRFFEIKRTVIGVRSALNKKFSKGIVIGDDVFICDNLMISGSFSMFRKNTSKIALELPGKIRATIADVMRFAEISDDRTEKYIGTPLAEDRAALALMKIHEEGGIPAQCLGKAWTEFKTPTHAEHLNEHGDRTVWTLAQALTQVHRPTAQNLLTDYSARTMKQTRILDVVADVQLAA
jgi:hypothetical protein